MRRQQTILAWLAGMSVFFGLSATAFAGHYATIVIDDDHSDWASVPVVDSDPADNPGSVDIATTQIANDTDFLYIRNTYHDNICLSTYLALDSDSDTATGYDIFGLGLIGSEAGWQNDYPFTQDAIHFNNGQGMSGEFFGSGAALLDAYADSNERELAISLDILFNADNAPVFPDNTLNLLFWTDQGLNGDVSAPIAYTLAQIPEPTSGLLICLASLCLITTRCRWIACIF